MEWSEKKDLTTGLGKFSRESYSSRLYSDLTIRCKDEVSGEYKEYHVHKTIVCLQSEFFANMCKPDSPFMEARTGIVNLDDNPDVIRYFLDLMYCERLEYVECEDKLFPGLPEQEAMILCDVELYAIADKYQAKNVKTHAAKDFHQIFEDVDPVIGHGEDSISISCFIKAIKRVFETTPESDRTLRNIVFSQTNANLSILMASPRFQSEMKNVDGFWSGYANWLTFLLCCRRTCPECGETTPIQPTGKFVDGEMLMQCPMDFCQRSSLVDKWVCPDEEDAKPANGTTQMQDGNPRKRRRSPRDVDGHDI